MSDPQDTNLDPFRMWREWYEKNEREWNEQLTRIMSDEKFAEGAGRLFQEGLQVQRMFTESMGQYLANLNMPTRSDVLSLGDRIGALEDALAGVQVELRQLRSALTKPSKPSSGEDAPAARPRRTRKPQSGAK